MLLLKSCVLHERNDHVNWKEIPIRREIGMNFHFEYCSIHILFISVLMHVNVWN